MGISFYISIDFRLSSLFIRSHLSSLWLRPCSSFLCLKPHPSSICLRSHFSSLFLRSLSSFFLRSLSSLFLRYLSFLYPRSPYSLFLRLHPNNQPFTVTIESLELPLHMELYNYLWYFGSFAWWVPHYTPENKILCC